MEIQRPPGKIFRLPLYKQLLAVFLRTFFHLLYHQFAWAYDWVAEIVSLGAWKNWVKSTGTYVDGPKTLEIGFGPGHLQVALEQKGITTFGVDESSEMSRIACKRLTSLGLPANLIRGDALQLPFANLSFNQVILTFPSEYILKPETLQEIHRVLVEGGSAFILPMAWITGKKPLHRLFAWINRITGKAPEWNEKSLEPWRNCGFDMSWEMIHMVSSKALLVKMRKL